jgi:hypothetical protein
VSLELVDSLLSDNADPIAAGWHLRDLAKSESVDGQSLLAELSSRRDSIALADPAILGGLLRVTHTRLLAERMDSSSPVLPSEIEFQSVDSLLNAIPDEVPNRFLLLHLLAMIRTTESLKSLVLRLDEAPPKNWIEAAQILSPLMQHHDWPIGAFFPDSLSLISHPSLASAILDIANYLFRSGRIDSHPSLNRAETLATLLGGVTSRLARFEEDPHSFGDDIQTVQQRLGEAVSLAISLCDSIGLIGNQKYIGRLNQTLELRHRRVQCEAAGALARLGDEDGQKRLVELASEPVCRLRAIHYADELGMGSAIDEKYRSDEATAEADMALWMSQPQQMGVPPTHVEVVESRRLLWPSFSGPVDVHLVRFEYNFGEQIYSNVGITGPVVFTLSSDVADLPTDDIYAIYAGWHAEHPDIFAINAAQLNSAQKRVVQPLASHLERHGYEDLQNELLGFFLDEQAAVFQATRESVRCRVVTDGLETIDHPIDGRLRPLSSVDLFNLYKGRKMLRTFNS